MSTITARCLLLSSCLSLLLTSSLAAADWPSWRHDSERSGATSETLPATLHLAWSRQLATPQPAWPEDPRIGFDLVPEPIVVVAPCTSPRPEPTVSPPTTPGPASVSGGPLPTAR